MGVVSHVGDQSRQRWRGETKYNRIAGFPEHCRSILCDKRWSLGLHERGKKQYEAFGNANYGATGTAAGISPDMLRREAGSVQENPDPDWGNPSGDWPYGDDPVDQVWIDVGINYGNRYNR